MKPFMDQDFLLSNDTAKYLYHTCAESLPIIDYHCHIQPQEIAEDRHFDNITQIWLGGDHYKWRFMRSCGIDERLITGDASDHDKFIAWGTALGKAIGNPLYHWSHLELQRYFHYYGCLNRQTAEEVWNHCNKVIAEDHLSAREFIRRSNVTLLCTTDDPVDNLQWHQKIAADTSFTTKVLPAWRPDRAMSIEKPDYLSYIAQVSNASGIPVHSFATLINALKVRMDFFADQGCSVSDHGISYVMYEPAPISMIEKIFLKRLKDIPLTSLEECQYKTAFLLAMAREYHRRGWTMQLHYGVKRNNNTRMFQSIGADTGFDCADNYTPAAQLADFLNALDTTGELPKTILYSLNPNDNLVIGTIIGCFQEKFQETGGIGKIQQGSAWWFNDHKNGMQEQMLSLASQGNLSGFLGMLTDSRSFLSYTRHEYFRRILCNLIGTLVENGEFPQDNVILKEIVADISYNNAVRYFEFPLEIRNE